MPASKSYSVALVGVSQYQNAIAACGQGEAVLLLHEPDNPHDDDAVAAVCHGDTIGYIGRGSWLRRALLDESKGCRARIQSINRGLDNMGVSLSIELAGQPIGERAYSGTE